MCPACCATLRRTVLPRNSRSGSELAAIIAGQKTICEFAPLRLNLPASRVTGTVFENQDKLKLVTHCQSSSVAYQQTVVSEYLAYRIFNLLTDISYRVRLVRMTYAYTDSDSEIVSYAFLIEHQDRFAERTSIPVFSTDRIIAEQLHADYASLVFVFEYLIGNTDFSPVGGAREADCCHNTRLFGVEDGPYYAVPYDFDHAGLVDAPHAGPSPRYRLRSVRQRLYLGDCALNELLPATLQRFREQQTAIEDLINSESALTTFTRKKSRRYIKRFFTTINDPKYVKRQLIQKCLWLSEQPAAS